MYAKMPATSQEEAQVGDSNGRYFRCYKKKQEYNVLKKELLLEIDFYGDAPALRNEFTVWLTSGFLEGSSAADAPDWFRTDLDKKTLARHLRFRYKDATSNHLQLLCFPVANARYQYLSDEAVECLGQHVTDEYFREKRSGLT
jgi:hypothetical protein